MNQILAFFICNRVNKLIGFGTGSNISKKIFNQFIEGHSDRHDGGQIARSWMAALSITQRVALRKTGSS